MEINKVDIVFFQDQLIVWYKFHGRIFSWRDEGLSPYELVIAEILLQRTRAETVAKFYPLFLKEFPNWKSLADANLESVESYLRPVGLYRQRAKRLVNLAEEMVRRDGVLPNNRKELEAIPFMGQYVANAVELVVFNMTSPLIDVNMARVIERFFGPRKMSDIRYDPYLQDLAYSISYHPYPKLINWAVLDFAALVCKARGPLCMECVLNSRCKYFLNRAAAV